MTPTETVTLVRLVKAKCPNQAIDTFTPEAWHDDVSDLRIEDCRLAVSHLIRGGARYIAVADIRGEVRRIRDDRIDRVVLCPPRDCEDETAWLVAARKAVGDGEWTEPSAELPPSDAVPRAIEEAGGAFQRVEW